MSIGKAQGHAANEAQPPPWWRKGRQEGLPRMTGQDAYYYMFRNLKAEAARVYNPTRLQEAKDLEDVALVIRYSFDGSNLQKVAQALGIESVNKFCGLLEFAAAMARIQRQVQLGGW